jgi:hypothetical protein
MDDDIEVVGEATGMLEAEILRGYLQAQGISVWLSHEAASTAYGLGVGPMATVQLLVRTPQASAARQALEDYRSGKHEVEE